MGSQVITRMGQTVLGRLKESTDLAPTCLHWAGWVEEGSAKDQWCLPVLVHRHLPNPCPSSLFLKFMNFDTPHISLELSELFPLRSAESVHGPF